VTIRLIASLLVLLALALGRPLVTFFDLDTAPQQIADHTLSPPALATLLTLNQSANLMRARVGALTGVWRLAAVGGRGPA
jgi:hypothetical protein